MTWTPKRPSGRFASSATSWTATRTQSPCGPRRNRAANNSRVGGRSPPPVALPVEPAPRARVGLFLGRFERRLLLRRQRELQVQLRTLAGDEHLELGLLPVDFHLRKEAAKQVAGEVGGQSDALWPFDSGHVLAFRGAVVRVVGGDLERAVLGRGTAGMDRVLVGLGELGMQEDQDARLGRGAVDGDRSRDGVRLA